MIYLGWRGLTLGAPPPRIETTLRRFTISLAVVVMACIGALVVPAALQATLQGALLTLLALDVFAGLAAAALSRRGGGREAAEADAGAETMRWLLTAFGAAALVIAVAFIIGLAFNFGLLTALLGGLGPVGEALNIAADWLVHAIAYLLWIAFVRTLGALFLQRTCVLRHSAIGCGWGACTARASCRACATARRLSGRRWRHRRAGGPRRHHLRTLYRRARPAGDAATPRRAGDGRGA